MRALHPFSVCISVLFLIWPGAVTAASFTLQKVVAAGVEAPQGGTFIQFEPAGINRAGAILFDALVKRKINFHGIYLAHDSSLSRVVATGETTPMGGTFIEFSCVNLNGRGHAVFLGSAKGRVPRAIFFTDGASLKKVVAVREAVPGVGVLREFSDVTFNDADTIAFVGRIERGKIPRALLLASAGVLKKVLGVGEQTPVGGRFAQLTSPSINTTGEIALEGIIYGGRAPSGIFVVSKSGVRTVVAVGQPSPLGGVFQDLALPKINDRGDVIFWASLEGAKIPSGLFLASQGRIEKIVARGDPTPGGGQFSFIELSYSFNKRKMVAFQAGITDAGANTGIFLAEKGSVTTVVRAGDPTPVGGRFSGLSGSEVSPDGSVAFAGEVRGGQTPSGLFLAVPQRDGS